MLEYLIDAKVCGTTVQLIRSKYCIVVIYGMQKEVFDVDEIPRAMNEVRHSINHAMEGV